MGSPGSSVSGHRAHSVTADTQCPRCSQVRLLNDRDLISASTETAPPSSPSMMSSVVFVLGFSQLLVPGLQAPNCHPPCFSHLVSSHISLGALCPDSGFISPPGVMPSGTSCRSRGASDEMPLTTPGETPAALTASRWHPLSQSAWGVISRIQTMSGLLGLSAPQTHLCCRGGKLLSSRVQFVQDCK